MSVEQVIIGRVPNFAAVQHSAGWVDHDCHVGVSVCVQPLNHWARYGFKLLALFVGQFGSPVASVVGRGITRQSTRTPAGDKAAVSRRLFLR